MRRALGLIVCLCATLLFAVALTLTAQAEVAINATSFPDANFRSYISESFDTDSNGKLSDAEISEVTLIYVVGLGIRSVEGIAYFPELQELWCLDNQLTEIDVGANPKLTTLNCCYNAITELDLSSCPKLAQLNCFENPLTELDLSACPYIMSAYANGTAELSADTGNYYALQNAYYDEQGYSRDAWLRVDATVTIHCPLPADVAINRTNFPDAEFRGIAQSFDSNEDGILSGGEILGIRNIYCSDAGISNMTGIEHFTYLQYLECNDISVKTLDLSACTMLETLDCSGTPLTSLQLSGNSLTTLYCADNRLTTLNLAGFDKLRTLVCSSDTINTLNLAGCVRLETLSCSVPTLDLSGCPNLMELTLGDRITYIDVSANAKLAHFTAQECQLTELDLSGNKNLVSISLYKNQLTQLDLSNNPNLIEVDCNFNQLTALNLKGCPSLTSLSCISNKLTTLDISGSPYLIQAYMEGERTGYTEDGARAYEYSLTDDESYWYTLCVDRTVTVLCEPEQLTINAANFPDAQFRSLISAQFDTDKNGKLSDEEILAVTMINCAESGISNLTGVQNFSALVSLSCQENSLTALSVAGLSALEELYCYGNKLTSLNISGCLALRELDCADNKLTNLNANGLSRLEGLYCSTNSLTSIGLEGCSALHFADMQNNQLTSVTLQAMPNLENLYLDDNRLTSLTIENCDGLKYLTFNRNLIGAFTCTGGRLITLECSNNRLTSLDLGAAVALSSVVCTDNQLATLDLTNNQKLMDLHCENNNIASLDISGQPKLIAYHLAGNAEYFSHDASVEIAQITELILPQDLDEVEAETFAGTSGQVVRVNAACRSIASRAFANISELSIVDLTACGDDIQIAQDAFAGCPKTMCILVRSGMYSHFNGLRLGYEVIEAE